MENRRVFIRNYLIKNGSATIHDLHGLFPDKSAMTIRRDLDLLEQEGFLIRTHGGARINPAYQVGLPVQDLSVKDSEERRVIARKIPTLIEGKRSLFVDAGVAVLPYLQEAYDLSDMTIMTNSIEVAHELLKNDNPPHVTILGGHVSQPFLSVTGSIALEQIENANIDTAILSTPAFSIKNGFTSASLAVCELKQAVIRRANRVIMPMLSEKNNRSMIYTFAGMKDIDVLVTDDKLDPETARAFRDAGVEVI